MRKLMLLLSMISFIWNITYSQTSYYYYKGEKEPLTIDKQRVSILVKKDQPMLSLLNVNPFSIEDTLKNSPIAYDFFVLKLTEHPGIFSYNSTIKSLEENKSVIRTEPCFISGQGVEIAGSPYLYVELIALEDLPVLYKYCELYNLEIVEQSKFFDHWFTLICTSETPHSSLEVANLLFESGNFAAVAPDFITNDLVCANDPNFIHQWGLKNNSYSDIDISACDAWPYSTGEGVVVALVDMGIDKTHMDLAANIHSLSYDTESGTSPSQLFGDHGTHCAGIIAAVKDNNLQITGVAPNARLMDISNSLDGGVNSRVKRAEGIKWAWQNGADIISNSWQSTVKYDVIDQAIAEALTEGRNGKGAVVIFATGNDYESFVGYPADCHPDILAVGSIANWGRASSFSNYGPELDVVAPGANILSTVPSNATDYMSGTSMACPHVAGIAALILSISPDLTQKQVADMIEKSAKKVGGYSYSSTIDRPNGTWYKEMGYGLVDAYGAVRLALTHQNRTLHLKSDSERLNQDEVKNISEIEKSNLDLYGQIRISPNPTTGIIRMEGMDNEVEGSVQIYNSTGKLIFHKERIANGEHIDLTTFHRGIYFARLMVQGESITQKIVLK